jgi:hypothetical protein
MFSRLPMQAGFVVACLICVLLAHYTSHFYRPVVRAQGVFAGLTVAY